MKQLLLDLFSSFSGRPPVRRATKPPALTPASELQARAAKLLRKAGCSKLADAVQVRWNPRMVTTAGLANYGKLQVVLNPRIAQFGPAEIDVTLRHELAHLLARDRAGRRRIAPHGPEWKEACRDLGIGGEKRCHTLPLPRREMKRRHVYRCGRCHQEVHRVRPFRKVVACFDCCRKVNGGQFDRRFQLIKVPLKRAG
jgi:SprT protein